jgi:hypothetical protein
VIAKESAALRQAFKEQDGTYRHRWTAAAPVACHPRLVCHLRPTKLAVLCRCLTSFNACDVKVQHP